MPIVTVQSPNSIRKKPLYLAGRRLYSQTQNNRPGLQEEIGLLPLSIIEILRSFIKPGISPSTTLHLGGGVSFLGNVISTKAEWIIKNDAVYYIEPLTVTVNTAARWGSLDIKLSDEEGEPTGLDFWDSSLDRSAFKQANTKILNKVLIQENYLTRDRLTVPSAGYTTWIRYKRDRTGPLGKIQSVEHIPPKSFSIYSPGTLSQVFSKIEVLTSSGTWTKPAHVEQVLAIVIGGGGAPLLHRRAGEEKGVAFCGSSGEVRVGLKKVSSIPITYVVGAGGLTSNIPARSVTRSQSFLVSTNAGGASPNIQTMQGGMSSFSGINAAGGYSAYTSNIGLGSINSGGSGGLLLSQGGGVNDGRLFVPRRYNYGSSYGVGYFINKPDFYWYNGFSYHNKSGGAVILIY